MSIFISQLKPATPQTAHLPWRGKGPKLGEGEVFCKEATILGQRKDQREKEGLRILNLHPGAYDHQVTTPKVSWSPQKENG